MTELQIFTSVIAQHENLGDVLLRQQMVRYLTPHGRLNVVCGDSPDDYMESLGLPRNTLLYRSQGSWLRRMLRQATLDRAALVYSPGPQLLTDEPRTLMGELSRLALTSTLRMTGSSVVRLGRSFEGNDPVMTRVARGHTRVMTLQITRDSRLGNDTSTSVTLPDLAVGAGDEPPSFAGNLLAVSIRYDRNFDLKDFATRVEGAADYLGLTPVIVSQVSYDEPNHTQLANLMHVEHVGNDSHIGRKIAAVTDVYRQSALTFSNRLHALVMGLTHGAVPWLLDTGSEQKIAAAIGELGVVLPSSPPNELSKLQAAAIVDQREQWSTGLQKARSRLSRIEPLLASALQSKGAS